MAKHILKCTKCSQYTMSQACPKCGALAITTQPQKYSPEDKYGQYRRKVKSGNAEVEGLF